MKPWKCSWNKVSRCSFCEAGTGEGGAPVNKKQSENVSPASVIPLASQAWRVCLRIHTFSGDS